MKLSELAEKPKLIPVKIENETIIEKYGDALEFWIYDRQPLNLFAKLASADPVKNFTEVAEIMSDLILDEDGKKVMEDGKVLPMDVLTQAVNEISKTLGK